MTNENTNNEVFRLNTRIKILERYIQSLKEQHFEQLRKRSDELSECMKENKKLKEKIKELEQEFEELNEQVEW